jgi:hypothetical protein
MKIAFHTNQMSVMGTEIAVFDYAYHNQTLLNNESFIISKKRNDNLPSVIEKFKKHFPIFLYNDFSEVEKILDDNKIDVFYVIKSGEYDGIISKGRKTVIHVVFGNAYQPHGDVYAYISEWLSKQMMYGIHPWVPHMINLPKEHDNLRNKLNIPGNAIVFGRYGGFNTFDIDFAHEAVRNVAKARKNVYFLFANTQKFCNEPNVIYLDTIVDLNEKVKFINTCDAMLHARRRGETFGIACGEFSIKNKPVITYGLSPEQCHLDILKDKCIKYYNISDLNKILMSFEPSNNNWDAYSLKYTPEKVMQKFKTVFL